MTDAIRDAPDGERRRIVVVVDDSPSALRLMVRYLGDVPECQPMGFTDSQQALAWCLSRDVDLVVVDYDMPPPDGLAFIKAYRAARPDGSTPLVMVTSSEDRGVRYEALGGGATDFLSKPVDRTEFAARIRNLLAAARAQRALADRSVWLAGEARKALEEEARGREKLNIASMVIEQSPVSVVFTDRDGVIEYVNAAFTEVSGYSREDAVGRKTSMFKSGETSAAVYQELWATILAGGTWRGTLRNRRKDGSFIWEAVRIAPVRDTAGRIAGFAAIKEDITLRREYEDRLNWQAGHDELTGMPNRMLAVDRLEQAIGRAAALGGRVAVLLVELGRFKQLRATLGPSTGDLLSRQAAERVRAVVSDTDTAARIGEDEFLVVSQDIGDLDAPRSLAARLSERLAAPFSIEGVECHVQARIGATICPDDGRTVSELLRNAHAAACLTDKNGRGGWRFFTSEIDSGGLRRLTLESRLRHALERDELRVHYQPVISIETGRVRAAEALLRWTTADLGPIPPDQFIPIAEDSGLIVEIGAWVLDRACRDMAGWAAGGLPEVRMNVNVSAAQLTDSFPLETVADILRKTGVAAESLELEVTERLLLDRSERTLSIFWALRDLGLRFAIDDFGTGHSAMRYLTDFPLDTLKIDRAFVARVTERDQDATLARAIVSMARGLDLDVIAEGVETPEQLEFLRTNGCDFAQGFLFSKPVPAETFARLLAEDAPRSRPDAVGG